MLAIASDSAPRPRPDPDSAGRPSPLLHEAGAVSEANGPSSPDLMGLAGPGSPEVFTPATLRMIFDAVYGICLASWVGSILFFSFGVAPIIFRVLPAESAAKFVRALFPRYYLWGAISAATALPAFLGVPLAFPEYRGGAVGLQALLIVASVLVLLYCGNTLTPAINAARDAGPAGQARFDRLHRRSGRLNGVVLAIGLGLLVGFAARPSPRTGGLAELPPEIRARQAAELSAEIDRRARQLAERYKAQQGADPEAPGTDR